MTFVINGTTGATQSASFDSASTFGFKNRIINGAMTINQRAATVTTASTFVTDRWQVDNLTTSGAVSFAQNSTAPAGFTSSLKITVTTADAAVASSDIVEFRQWIEGYNTADFSFGSASAGTFTVSFWVNSSVTGTYGVSFRNSASDRVYVSTYTVNAANTWEQKTITVAGDTSGTWLTDSGRGLGIAFCVMGGSNFQGTANAWGSTNNRTTSAQANLLATINNTFYITGVQLEKGSTATSFDYRPYGTELQLCQRYYYRVNASELYTVYAGGGWNSTTSNGQVPVKHPVRMRVAPTVLDYSALASTILGVRDDAVAAAIFTPSGNGTDMTTVSISSAALFSTGAMSLTSKNTTSSYLGFGAEL